ncbi:MAG: hypothetical protein ACLVKO_09195 [Dysgonomonas sp.]
MRNYEDNIYKIEQSNGMVIKYPKLGFAFNPIRITLESFIYKGQAARLVVNDTITIDRFPDPITNTVHFDLSPAARSIFNAQDLCKINSKGHCFLKKDIKFEIKTSKNWKVEDAIFIPVIWGALQIGEVYSQTKTLTCFRGYPFTVPLFLESEYMSTEKFSIKYRYDDEPYDDFPAVNTETGSIGGGKYNLDISGIPARRQIVLRVDSQKSGGIFDYTFDYTFRRIEADTVMIKINVVDCPNEGVYLRWINQYGEWCYYLLQSGAESTTVKDIDVKFDNLYGTTYFVDRYHGGIGKSVGKDIETSTKLFVSLADENTYRHLLSLVQSPVVDMFAGYDDAGEPYWISVTLKDGTFARSTDDLQDFECFLIPNKTLIQTL